jgi:uncharacterized pyridoxal phosphate-containing UPF0001 family protein
MEVIIDKSKTLSAIQKEFQKRFPYLKIEFYQSAHAQGEGSPKKSSLNTALTIDEAQQKDASGVIKIQGLMTVAELESAFNDIFGLSTQVFRKSGDIWLQTTGTDHWTLVEQNHKAMERYEQEEDIIDAKDRMELE